MLGLEYLLVILSLQGKLWVCLDCLRSGRRSPVSGWLACVGVTRLTIARMTRDTLFGHKGQQFCIPTSVSWLEHSRIMREEDKNRTVTQWEVWSCKKLNSYFYILLLLSIHLWVGAVQMQMIGSRIFGDDIFRQQFTNVYIRISGEWDVVYVDLAECLSHKWLSFK